MLEYIILRLPLLDSCQQGQNTNFPMHKFSLLFIIALMVQTTTWAQKKDCVREATFGDTKFCLPKFDGFVECADDKVVEAYYLAAETEDNQILGYYLNDKFYPKRKFLSIMPAGETFKLYSVKLVQDIEITSSDLELFIPEFKTIMFGPHWEEVEAAVQERFSDLEVGKPSILKEYKLNNSSYTFLTIIKYSPEGEEDYYTATGINVLILKFRVIIWSNSP